MKQRKLEAAEAAARAAKRQELFLRDVAALETAAAETQEVRVRSLSLWPPPPLQACARTRTILVLASVVRVLCFNLFYVVEYRQSVTARVSYMDAHAHHTHRLNEGARRQKRGPLWLVARGWRTRLLPARG